MGVFRFKKFEVVNERSAMKVNTDGVLLGAAMTILPSDKTMLDVGTGTGTIALMAAQRLSVILNEVKNLRIDAIDIDEASASEAAANFSNSPWNAFLIAHHSPLEEFASSTKTSYDLIFSNPPYFEDSLIAPDERKSTARHTSEGLSYRDIFEFAKERLSENGRVSLVLPADQEAALTRYARMCGLHLFRILRVRTVPRKDPSRIIAEFSRIRCEDPVQELLTIQDEGKYTQEYLSLTRDFYLFA
jgi:tRNA1Val (adenine37-N6)-methyltransferase